MKKINLKMIIYAMMACVFIVVTAFNLGFSNTKVDVTTHNLKEIGLATESATGCRFAIDSWECDREDLYLHHDNGDCWCGNYHDEPYDEVTYFYAVQDKCIDGSGECYDDCVYPLGVPWP